MSAIAPGLVLLAYLCGSISSAILVCRLAGLPDPRDSGSGNPGATNVLRIGGKGAAVAVLIFDVLKGMLPVWGAWALGLTPFWLGLVAIAACVGHIWPVFFHFRGGKGVATAFGAIAPIGLDLTGVMAGTWLLTILLSGYSSLGAIVSALIAPFYVWWFKPQYTFPVSMLSCLILLRHHDNIQRLWRRQESKIWTRVKKKKSPEEKESPLPTPPAGGIPGSIYLSHLLFRLTSSCLAIFATSPFCNNALAAPHSKNDASDRRRGVTPAGAFSAAARQRIGILTAMIIRVNNPERLCRFPLAPDATLRVTDDISVSYDRDNLPPINTHCCCFILILQGRNIARHRVTTTQKRLAGHAGSALSAGRRQDRSRQRPTRRPADRPAPVLPGTRDLSPLSASPPRRHRRR